VRAGAFVRHITVVVVLDGKRVCARSDAEKVSRRSPNLPNVAVPLEKPKSTVMAHTDERVGAAQPIRRKQASAPINKYGVEDIHDKLIVNGAIIEPDGRPRAFLASSSDPNKYFSVREGDFVPGYGECLEISEDKRLNRWVVRTQKGELTQNRIPSEDQQQISHGITFVNTG